MDAKMLGGTLAVGLAFGFAAGYTAYERRVRDCEEVARQTDHFGPSKAGQAMAFAECMSPKEYRLRPQ
jgi:hypothetical protein